MTAQFPLMRKIALAAGIMLLATACSNQYSASLRSITPIPEALRAEMSAKGMPRTSKLASGSFNRAVTFTCFGGTSCIDGGTALAGAAAADASGTMVTEASGCAAGLVAATAASLQAHAG